MAYKNLRNWLRGIISDNDSLDMPEDSLAASLNYIIKPGMLEQRPKPVEVISSGLTALTEFREFSIFDGSGTSRFILLRDGNDLEKYILSGSPVSYAAASLGEDGYGVAASIFTQSGNRPFFYTINNTIRITRVADNDSVVDAFDTLWYGYINRSYFNSINSLADWYLETAKPEASPGGNHTTKKLFVSAEGSGNMTGRYFIRWTYEYDGFQESWHKDDDLLNGEYYDYADASSDEYISIQVNKTTADYNQSFRYPLINKRITAINIYMAFSSSTSDTNPRTAFYKVARIDINDSTWALDYTLDTTLDTDEAINDSTTPLTFDVDGTIGSKIYPGEYIKIESEVMYVTAVTAGTPNTVTVTRSSPAAHLTNQDIYLGRPKIEVRVKLSGSGQSTDFPANHECYNTNEVNYSFEEEYYLRHNSLPNITEGYDVKSYSHGVWVNGRHFIFRPNVEFTRIKKSYGLAGGVSKEVEPPYDKRQTVLFSKLNQPDCFDFMVDYIDCSTEEGDPVISGAEINGDLIVLKKHNMFVISLNNTGNSLAWGILQHIQKVGSVSRNGTAKGNGMLFFPGEDNVFLYDGRVSTPITHNKVRESYLSQLSGVSDYENIYSVFDPHRNRFLMYLPGSSKYVWIYELGTQAWSWYSYGDTTNKMDIKSLGIGNDLEIFAGNDDGDMLLQLEVSGGATESAQPKTFTTQWMQLTDNPNEEARLSFIRLDMNLAGGTYNVYVYANGEDTSFVWSATSQTAQAGRSVHYHEVSELGRLFKVAVSVTTQSAKFYGLELNYIPEGDQQ